jgi:hypothetical protein
LIHGKDALTDRRRLYKIAHQAPAIADWMRTTVAEGFDHFFAMRQPRQ